MSPSTSTNERRTPAGSSLAAPLKAGAFWAAVLMPFVALVLIANGIETTSEFLTLGGLVTLNVVALVVGHDYGQ